MKFQLVAVAVSKDGYPPESKAAEIAFCGRSNSGKSSLLNAIAGSKKLARISSSPGKTRTINFFEAEDGKLRIVDLPGYGYAKASKNEIAKWGDMIEEYLRERKPLKKIVILLDSRREPSEKDIQMIRFAELLEKETIMVLTKIDKLSAAELSRSKKAIEKSLAGQGINGVKLLYVSAEKRKGVAELLNEIRS